MRIILGSKSARRRELMDLFVPNYEIIVSNADETLEEGLSIEEQCKKLGYIKAKAVFDETEGDRIVIGSDTMVVKDGILYGKPKDFEEAVEMLNTLKNTKHQVITSLAILIQEGENYSEYIDYDRMIVITAEDDYIYNLRIERDEHYRQNFKGFTRTKEETIKEIESTLKAGKEYTVNKESCVRTEIFVQEDSCTEI